MTGHDRATIGARQGDDIDAVKSSNFFIKLVPFESSYFSLSESVFKSEILLILTTMQTDLNPTNSNSPESLLACMSSPYYFWTAHAPV